MTDHCLIGCITSDDEGRGYYCEECPELRRAHRAPLREGPVPEHQVGSIADLHAADDSALIGPDGFTRLSGEPERIAARAVELATERDAALARIARAERLIDSWERDAPDHSNPVFIGRLREALRRDPVPVRLRGVPTETPSEERCVVCSRSAPRHGGLCCFHKYDEQPTCDVCAADEDPS